MLRRAWLALLVLAIPGVVRAQEAPEKILPAGTQVYFQWEGVDAHREAFNKSAVGKMLQGDTGKFLSALWDYIGNQIDAVVGQFDPQAAAIIKDIPRIFESAGKNGFILGVEVRGITPPQVQGTLVFPKSGEVILGFLKRVTETAMADVKEVKAGKRTISQIDLGPVHIGWWAEGSHAVIVVGTDDAEKVAQRVDKGPDLTTNELYRAVKGFKEFPTWARAFIDFTGAMKKVKDISPEVSRLIDELGLDGLKSITFQSGFDGPGERAIVEIHTPGPRKGLLKLASQKPITLADLPPMPDDVNSFSIASFDFADLYDALVSGAEAVVRVFAPGTVDVQEALKQAKGILGIDLREDLFAAFGHLNAKYNSPAEGPLSLGSVYAFKLKDAKKVQKTLETIEKAIPLIPNVEINVKTNKYRDVEIREIHIGGPGNFTVPSFAIHKGWLVVSNFPQPIKGFILRADGELPTWKASAELTRALEQFPKEFTSVSVSDPRPSLKAILSFIPPVLGLVNNLTAQFLPGAAQFDVSLIPNAHEAVRHLFPNITVTTDDGKKIRMETRASLALPF